MALIDVRCRKCNKRYGFSGKMTDQPPCPRCGHVPDPAKLAEAERKIQEAMRGALSKHHDHIADTMKPKQG